MNNPALASNVLAVIVRVAGPVITEVRPHAVGYPERQVSVRLGDVLLYLTEPKTIARLRQRWDGAQYLATRLPEQVSQTWLAHEPDRYPLGVSLQLTGEVKVEAQWIAGRRETRTPSHLRIRADRVVWQVCDRVAWRAIGDALFEAQRYMQQE
jgi:hypothetical protein